MHSNAGESLNCNPGASIEVPDAIGILRNRPLKPGIDFDKAIRGFSAALHDLKMIITAIAGQQEREASAEIQQRSLEQHYRELFAAAPGGYLVTDIYGTIQESNQAAANLLQTPQDSLTNKRLVSFVSRRDQEIFQSLMDSGLQEGEIREIKVQVRPPKAKALPIILSVAGRRNPAGEIIGFNWLLQSLPPCLRKEESLPGEPAKIESHLMKLVEVFSTASEMQDPYALGHQKRVAQLGVAMAQALGFSPGQVEGLKITALLHDIGMVAIPAHILNKPGMLSVIESKIIKAHSELGYDLLKDIEFPWPVAQAVLQHHERWNGSGYPHGLSANDIIVEARIIAVADVVDAMLSPRPYGSAVGIQGALGELYKERGILYDPQVVDTCLKLFVEKDFKFD